VTVEAAALTGTQNGLRIKTWGKPNRGSVTGVVFSRVTMRGVHNPIVVDQNYCPGHDQCPGKVRQIGAHLYTYVKPSTLITTELRST
jgi:polygalacturonase